MVRSGVETWREVEADAAALPVDRASHEGVEPRAFRALFEAQVDFVMRLVRRFGGPEIDADCAAQDVFLVIHRQLPGFEGRAELRTWIYRICCNVAAEHRRRAQRRARLERALSLVAFWREPAALPNAEVELRDEVLAAQASLSKLSAPKREVFILCELEELTSEEAAEVLGVPAATVRTRLHHARKALLRAAAKQRGVA